MDTLESRSVKAIVDNFDYLQTLNLAQWINDKLNRMKVIRIKEALTEEFQKYENLHKFIPLIERIYSIELDHNSLIVKLVDVPTNKRLEMSEDGVYVMTSNGMEENKEFWRVDLSDMVTHSYLENFAYTLQDTYNLNFDNEEDEGDDYAEWGLNIKEYLSPKGEELVLTIVNYNQ